MDIKGMIEKFADEKGICAGVGSADVFDASLKEYLLDKKVPFVNFDVDYRINPSLTLSNVKSLICVAVPYNQNYTMPKDGKIRGSISAAAVGQDYHKGVGEILQALADRVLQGYEYMCFTDTGPLVDREVAKRCGIGFEGKNHSIITKKYGGMVFLGYILTNAAADSYSTTCADGCGACRRCIEACPGNAIREKGFEYEKCISYLTQCKDNLTEEQMRILGRCIYGCDVCQRVCPYNKAMPPVVSEGAFPDIEELLHISNRDFKRLYGNTAAGWRGKKILQRNALIALGNMKTQRAAEIAAPFQNDERMEIAAAARRVLSVKKS